MIETSIGDAILAWFGRKGISPETVIDFDISVAGDGAVVFPYGEEGNKLRYGIPTGERSFRWAKGVDPVLFNRRDLQKRNLFLCEGETDTMALRERLGDNPNTGVVGLPGIETWNLGMADDLSSTEKVWVVLDNDSDYKVAGRVDTAWRAIRQSLGRKAQRINLPRGINDLCEFFEDLGLDSLRLLVERQPRAGESRFKSLDLTQEPPEIRWLVQDMICMGDVHLVIGDPGIGKSWITMGLALAVAGKRAEYLGHQVATHGDVLYVDEENPEDLIFDRFAKLGVTKEAAGRIRFLSNVGFKLDKDPDGLIDEALEYSPALIVLDSLTRFHSQDENSAGGMAALFNDAIKPLARQTGAAVVLIHHTNKTDSTSGFKRARGSGDISASPDAGFDVREIGKGTLQITGYKSRRAAQSDPVFMSIVDTDDGVELLSMSGFNAAF